MGLKYHFVNNKFELRSVHGEFKKWPGTTKSHVMTEQLPELWAGVDVFSTTTDCAAEMVKTGRLLKDGKVADNDGPALPALNIVWNGCAAHRLDKMYALIAKHPELEGLMNKLTAITTHVNKSSQVCHR